MLSHDNSTTCDSPSISSLAVVAVTLRVIALQDGIVN